MITVFGCPVNSDYLEMLLKSAGYDPADESGVVKIVATDDGKVTVHWPDGTTSELVGATAGGTAGVTDFISLTDTPSAYSGSETYYLVVNSAGDSVVFEDRPNYLNGFNLYDDDTLPEVSFDGTASRTVTVSPKTASGTFVFWSDNKKFTKTASETVTIPDTTGGYYIYYDDSGTLQYVTDPPSSDLLTKYALVAHVYWNADYPSEYIWNDNELHGIDMRGAEHLYAHYAFGARWKSGLDINGLTVGSTDYTGSDSGYIYDEDIEHSFSANTTGHPWIYRWGSNGAWRKSAADLKVAYKESGDTYYSYNWYNTASGTWEWKEGTSSTDYWITFFAAVPGVGIVKVPGQAAYSNRANARDAIPTELSRLETEGLPNPEICWLGAVIVKRDGKLQSLADGTVFYDLRMGRGGGTTSKAASAFIDLTDVPGSYSGEAGKAPLVKSTEDGLEFVDVATAGHTHSWGDISKSGSKLSDLDDVPAYQADKVLGVDSSGTTLQWVTNSGGGGTAGATTYLELDDTPSSYSGQAGKVPVVKSDESGLDWFDAASAGHTHTASEITDFDNEVSNNTDVAANTSARHSHSNKTLLDSLISSGSGTEFLADDGSYKAVSTVDEKVKADSGDSSAGYLSDKVDGTTIEINTASHTIQVVDGIYASAGHTHDDRYYTETEADSLFSPALEVDYYVDYVSGSDTNDGSSSSPFKTLQHAISEIPFGGAGNIYLLSDVTVTSNVTLENISVRLGRHHGNGKKITFDGGIFYIRNSNLCFDDCSLDVKVDSPLFCYSGTSFIALGGFYGVTIKFYNSTDSISLIRRHYASDGDQDSTIVTLVSMVRVSATVDDAAGQQCYMYKHNTYDWGQVFLVQSPKDSSFDSLVSQNIPIISTSDEKVAVDSSSTPDYLGNLLSGSLEISSGKAQLKNDSSSPGAWKVYGTNGSGTRGWIDKEDISPTSYVMKVAEPSWESLADAPTAKHFFAAAADADGNIYAAGGWNYDKTFEVYDSSTQTWSSKTDLPKGLRWPVGICDSNGNFHVIGGYDGSSYQTTHYIWDGSAWTSSGTLSTGRAYHNACIDEEDNIYVFCGYAGSALGSVEKWSPSTSAFSTLTASFTARFYVAGDIQDNKLIVVCGKEGSSFTNRMESLDLSTGLVTDITPSTGPPIARGRLVAKTLADGCLHLCGGDDNSTVKDAHECWTGEVCFTSNPLPSPARSWMGVSGHGQDGNLYLVKGWDASSDLKDVDKLSVALNCYYVTKEEC